MRIGRAAAYRQLEPSAWPRAGLSPINQAIAILICIAVAFATLESEPAILAGRDHIFLGVEAILTPIFIAEYVARLWVASENPRYTGRFGRLRYVLSWPALLDLAALSSIFLTALGSEAFLLRLFRLLRILRIARLGRFSSAMAAIDQAMRSRRYELLMSLGIASLLLLTSSTLLYLVEGDAQPDSFGSIPRAMWWSVATLTTVGYGDVAPITPFGKILAGATALTGIGLIAMPTGILAAAFSDALQRQRDAARHRDE